MGIELSEDKVLFAPSCYQVSQNNIWIVIDPEWPNWIATDSRGARILSLIDGRRGFREIVQEYSRLMGLDWARAWLHAHTFVRDALRAELVALTPFVRAPYPGRSQVLKPERLRELWIHVTNACNLACSHCLVESGPDGLRGITTESWKRIIDEALELGAERFYMTGGEPFVREDIFDLIEHITKRSELIVLTNAMLLRGERLRRLQRFDPERLKLQISLDGSRPEINDPVRGPGAFEATIEGVKNAIRAGFEPTITTVAMSSNADDLAEVTRLAAALGVKNHHLIWTHLRGRARRGGRNGISPPSVEKLIDAVKKVLRVAREVGVKIDNFESMRLRVSGRRGVKYDLSNAAYDSLCVYADGHVYPSAASAGFASLDMGDAIRSGLRRVWLDSEMANQIRELTVQRKARAKDSYLKFFTGGGEIEHSYFYSANGEGKGDFLAADPFTDLYEFLVLEAMYDVASERSRLRTRSAFDAPIIYYAMGEDAIDESEHSLAGGFQVNTLHSTCVLSFDLDRSRDLVRRFYAQAAVQPQSSLCCPTGPGDEDLSHIPEEVLEVSYGCGSPVSMAELRQGEVMVDLGSGGGIDCFIAARKVGPTGKVVGIDMTDEMLARANAARPQVAASLGYDVVEFRKGYLEEIPLPDKFADCVTSNCVINLSPDKRRVFREMWRVLKDHGRIVISDTVAAEKLPDHMRANPRLWGECVSGALTEEEYLAYLERIGFYGLSVLKKSFWKEIDGYKFYSVTIRGYKFEKRAGCLYVGQKAIYRGPFKAVIDEEGHLFPRNEAVEVCTDTAAKLKAAPYSAFFTVIDVNGKSDGSFSVQAESSCCAPGSCC